MKRAGSGAGAMDAEMGEGAGEIGAGAARVGAGTGVGEAEAGVVPLEWLAEALRCHVRISRRRGRGLGSGFKFSLALARLCLRNGEEEAASLAYKRAVGGGWKEEAALAGRDGKGEARNGS
nr:unnamed protein product [Digitaria exilis]